MLSSVSRVFPLIGLLGGYALVMWSNPIRLPLRDGFRCLGRFKRVWLTFALLGFGYFVFQFATFTPIQQESDLDFSQVTSLTSWHWPKLIDVWRETPLPALEGVAGLFDNATTTYPLSVIAAILLAINWRGLHGALLRAIWQRFRGWSIPLYLVVMLSLLASLLKPFIFWRLPAWGGTLPAAPVLQVSAVVDTTAFIFEYFFGIYIQVYLITVCLAWIKGLSFTEESLFRFAMRRFSYALKWAGVVIVVSLLMVRLPLLLAYFMNIPDVLDYLPRERLVMSVLIILFSSVQISLVLHNEKLRQAIHAHWLFLRNNPGRFGWFLLIAAMHFFLLMAADAIVRGAIADRTMAIIIWKVVYVFARGFDHRLAACGVGLPLSPM